MPLTTLSTASANVVSAANSVVLTQAMLTESQPIRVQNQSSLEILRFPLVTPPYYMTIGINEYSRQSWRSVGELNLLSSINLPVPNSIIDNHSVSYDPDAQLGVAGLGWEMIRGKASNDSLAKKGQDLLAAGGAAAAGALGGSVAQSARDAVLAATGRALNNFLTVMLRGPAYKKRDFTWKFSPNNPGETEQLRRIGDALNNAMAPELPGQTGSVFFLWPRIFTVQFRYKTGEDVGKYVFRMKPMVLTDAAFNYTGAGQPVFFGGTHAPEVVEIHLSFLELEYWLRGDFGQGPGAAGTANFV